MTPVGAPARLYLLYDPTCPLCCRLRDWVQRCDAQGVVCLVPLDAPCLPHELAHLDLERAWDELTAQDQDGQVFRGLAAVRQVALRLPMFRRLGWVYELPGVEQAGVRLYQAANRFRKRRCDRCGRRWMPSDKPSVRRRRRGLSRRAP